MNKEKRTKLPNSKLKSEKKSSKPHKQESTVEEAKQTKNEAQKVTKQPNKKIKEEKKLSKPPKLESALEEEKRAQNEYQKETSPENGIITTGNLGFHEI